MAYRRFLLRSLALVMARNMPRQSCSSLLSSAGLPGLRQAADRNLGIWALNQSRLMSSKSRAPKPIFDILNGADFQERVLNSDIPVVVDFYAQWCAPCKILRPRLERAVIKHQGKVLMAKVDIYDNMDLACFFEVSAVPTVLAIKNGIVVDKFVGLKDEQQLAVFLNKLINC